MEFLNGNEGGSRIASHAPPATSPVESSTPERLEALVETLVTPGSVTLLIGEAGTGKHRLAQEAAAALPARLGEPVTVISMRPPSDPLGGIATHFGYHFPELLGGRGVLEGDGTLIIDDPDTMGARLLEAIDREAERGAPLLIAQGVDQYSPVAAMLLDTLVRSRACRIIATAKRVSGAAAHLARDARVRKLPVPPLTVHESRRLLAQLLGAEHVELHTLRRWYRATGGNLLSLTLLALALDRQGLLGRHRGAVFELPGAEAVPAEFGEFLRNTCSPEELRTLELIAHVEPMSENVFIQLLNPEHVAQLRDRGILSAAVGPNGQFTLALRHQLLTAAVREQMSPERVVEVSTLMFDALRRELGPAEPYHTPRLLFRMVAMGLEAERSVPLGWLWEALEILRSGHELHLRLRVALAVAGHPDASTIQLATAALQASQIARLLGDRGALIEALERVRGALDRMRRGPVSSPMIRAKLQVALVEHHTLDRTDAASARAILDELEREFGDADERVVEAIRSARVLLLARTGGLREAAEAAPDPDEFGTMPVEWVRSHSRAVSSLVLGQRGRFGAAIRLAEYAGSFAEMGEQPQIDSADLLRFCGFVGYWACGAVESARDSYAEQVAVSFTGTHYSGLVDTCGVLMSLADGKWRLAAQRAERLRARLAGDDRHGLAELANAGLALALAALGEREGSRRAIRSAEGRQFGISHAVDGYLRLLTLRARQWNGEADTARLSLRLAGWARQEGLEAIELQALHLLAMEAPEEAAIYRGRVRALAEDVEPPLSLTLLDHCEELMDGRVAWDTPAARSLTEFGIWMPLPLTEELSSREREIAMFAALGYSSRWIAEQFHLSVRTVDTHLRHVFTKLHVRGRDELRLWFRREHGA